MSEDRLDQLKVTYRVGARLPWPGQVRIDVSWLISEVEQLRSELAEAIEEAFLAEAYLVKAGEDERAGWYDTCALSSTKRNGDRLVELGLYERHPEGAGRRWFYRRKDSECQSENKPASGG